MQTYIVQSGDTLYGISKQFGVSVESIKAENKITNNNIYVGEVLKIPSIESSFFYVVKKGDTLYSIALKYGVSVDELIKINNLKNNNLTINQELKIPINSNDTGYLNYTVKVGDTLYSIAKNNNVSVIEIIDYNNLKNTVLQIGQILKIPKNNNSNGDNIYSYYVVRDGDNLYSIAKIYNMSVDEIKRINNLSSNDLKVGQVLRVFEKDDSNLLFGKSCYGSGYVEPTYITYVVKKGDNLYLIASKYNVSVDEIKKLNNLNSNLLSIGQVLKIKEV